MKGEKEGHGHGTEEQQWAIIVKDLSFSWDYKTPVLDSCSLAVPRGQLWMLLGSNGCGKSTLLRILANLLVPDSGEVYIESPVGFVFQNPDHQLVMPTVGADIAFGLAAEKLTFPQIQERVKEALAAVNLPDFQTRPIHTLSGGQKQRVAIAGALARHCRVLLLDEPTALLDTDNQMELVTLVRKIVDEKHITALWVTHRLEELNYADGYFLIKGGRVVQQGHPRELGIITS